MIYENLLTAGACRAFYTLRGEITDPAEPYAGFSVCHYTGDDAERVAANRRLLADSLGISTNGLIIPRQTHSANVLTITDLPVADGQLQGIDALVTSLRGVAIGVNTADCVPVALADPVAGVIAVAHAGWRGAVGGVLERTVEAMMAQGATPGNIRAALGPHICADCFEVGDEVAAQFPSSAVIRRPEWPRPHVSLATYILYALEQSGITVLPACAGDLCTRCHPDRFFSARRLGVHSGRIFTFAIIGG